MLYWAADAVKSISEGKCIIGQRHLVCRCEKAESEQRFHTRWESTDRLWLA